VYGTYVYEHDKNAGRARLVDTSPHLGKTSPKEKPSTSCERCAGSAALQDTEDSGSITVRYVVRAVNPGTVSIRVDAVFIEVGPAGCHPSEGAVESAEFGQVQQHLNAFRHARGKRWKRPRKSLV